MPCSDRHLASPLHIRVLLDLLEQFAPLLFLLNLYLHALLWPQEWTRGALRNPALAMGAVEHRLQVLVILDWIFLVSWEWIRLQG